MRRDKKNNREQIHQETMNYLRQYKRMPSIVALAKLTGLSERTISKHVDHVLITADPVYRILTDDVVLSIYRSAMKGSSASQKLWFQIIENWSEKTDYKVEGELKIEQQPPVVLKLGQSKAPEK